MPNRVSLPASADKVPAATSLSERVDKALVKAQQCMTAAQARQKCVADRSRRDVVFDKGDLVLLKAKNFKFKAPGAKKLFPKYLGPFTVDSLVGKAAVKLQLPTYGNWDKVHDVFHMSLLRKYHARIDSDTTLCPPALTFEDGAAIWEVEAIMAHRMTKNGKKVKEYLVRWVGWPPEHDQWEPVSDLKGAPDLVEAYNEKHGLCSHC